MEEVDKEISEMKLFVRLIHYPVTKVPVLTYLQLNARARFVAESFLTPVCDPQKFHPDALAIKANDRF